MHYVKNHLSNVFNGLTILLGVFVAIIGSSNLELLNVGIVSSIASFVALILSVREGRAAEKDAERKEQTMKQWMDSTQLRIDFESMVNAPGFEQQSLWDAFDKAYPDFCSAWSIQPGEA